MKAAISAPAGVRRVCVVAERMSGPLDEGGRKFAHQLTSALKAHVAVIGISVGGPDAGSNGNIRVRHSRTFAGLDLRRPIRHFQPDVICYVPQASATLPAVARARALKLAFPAARLAVVAAQPRKIPIIARPLFRALRPDIVLTLSRHTAQAVADLGCPTAVLPPAVDLERFRPVADGTKHALRTKYGLDQEAFIVLHVGHAKRERGVDVLASLDDAARGVLVAASSEGADPGLVRHLRSQGVAVIDQYIPDIHELYQAADCYVFPVLQPDASIDAPLSVFEAMGCNLPVVTTPFGTLPETFSDGHGVRFAETREALLSAVRDRAWMTAPKTRDLVTPFSWDNLTTTFLNLMENAP